MILRHLPFYNNLITFKCHKKGGIVGLTFHFDKYFKVLTYWPISAFCTNSLPQRGKQSVSKCKYSLGTTILEYCESVLKSQSTMAFIVFGRGSVSKLQSSVIKGDDK